MSITTEDIEAIAKALVCEGVLMVYAEYSGYGDSGEFHQPRFYRSVIAGGGENEATDAYDVMVAMPSLGKEYRLQQAVWDRLFDLVEANYGGYENNDGGEGVFQWDLRTQVLEWHHTWYERVATTSAMKVDGENNVKMAPDIDF